MTSTASEIERMPTFSIRRLNQIGDAAFGLKLSSERSKATIAPSEILIGVPVPVSENVSDLACVIGSVKFNARAPAISRAAPRMLSA